MSTFIVRNSGIIKAISNLDGTLIVEHSGSGRVELIVDQVCNGGRALWNQDHRHWIVYQNHAEEVLTDLSHEAVLFQLPITFDKFPPRKNLIKEKPPSQTRRRSRDT
jgi:hypothetical protein